MSFTGSYSISQGNDPSKFVLTDTSNYTSEPANTFTTRRITLEKTDGETLVTTGTTTTYIDFPYSAGNQIQLDVLDKDYSLNITVDWIQSNPQSGSVYSLSVVYSFIGYSREFQYGLIQQQAANPDINRDTKYKGNCYNFALEISNCTEATWYQDQFAAQAALDRAKYMMDNQILFF